MAREHELIVRDASRTPLLTGPTTSCTMQLLARHVLEHPEPSM